MMKNIFKYTLWGVLLITSVSCQKRVQDEIPATAVDPGQKIPMHQTTCEFIKFDQADGNGRCADFKLTNKSDHIIIGVRGLIIGYDSEGIEIYTFPWGSSKMPQLVGARSEAVIEDAGFEIPPEAERVEYKIEDIDLK